MTSAKITCFAKHSFIQKITIGYVNETSYIQKSLDTQFLKPIVARKLSQPMVLQVQVSSSIGLRSLEIAMQKKMVVLVRNYMPGFRISFTVQLVLTVSSCCTKMFALGCVYSLLKPKLLY